MLVVSHVSIVDVISQVLDMIDPLLANEDRAALEADLAEGLLVVMLQMPHQGADVRELRLMSLTILDETVQSSEVHAGLLSFGIRIENVFVLLVLDSFLLHLLVEVGPRQIVVISNDDFIQFSLADGALVILKNNSEPEPALVADILMLTAAEHEVIEVVVA